MSDIHDPGTEASLRDTMSALCLTKEQREPKQRPLLRYHGGKWLLAPWILAHLPTHRIYVEPYGGAASVLLRKQRSYAEVYNDLDGELVNLFRIVRERGRELQDLLRVTPFARDEFSASYEPSRDPLEQARRTVVRSFMGFGSNGHNQKTGFRSNSNRSGTTPAADWKHYPDALAYIIDRLQGVVIENKPALELLPQHDTPETVFYVDPPYCPETRDPGGDYSHEMTSKDHRALAEVLHSLQGMIVLSGYACDLYDLELYMDWARIERPSFADGARKRTEVLWFNDCAWARKSRQLPLITFPPSPTPRAHQAGLFEEQD